MYVHDKNKKFAHFLKQKAEGSDIEEQHDQSVHEIEPKKPLYVRVFDTDRMIAITEENGKNSNLHRNHKKLLSQLEDTRGYLPLAELPDTIFEDLDALGKRFPNFQPVIDFYKQEFALARLTENPVFTAEPLLIAGPPGVGKTYFCHELARLVDTHFEFISMSSMTAGFVLSGNSSKWSEGSFGKVAQGFAVGKRPNQLLVIDEVDKAGGDSRHDSLGCLYTLLEKETASKFIDEALEIPIDASHAVWIATGNYLDRIPEPILSRFTAIEVNLPSLDQMHLILDSIYARVRQNHKWGELFQAKLHKSVTNKLINSGLEPRLLQKILITACGRAVIRSATAESVGDKLSISINDLDSNQLTKQTVSKAQTSHAARNQPNEPDVVIMPIFNIPMWNNQYQEEVMILWSVYEIEDGNNKSHHLVGYLPKRQTGRVTSAIKQFEKNLMKLITSSGRIYQLDGPPALNGENKLIWSEWKEKYSVDNYIDVTHQYLTMH